MQSQSKIFDHLKGIAEMILAVLALLAFLSINSIHEINLFKLSIFASLLFFVVIRFYIYNKKEPKPLFKRLNILSYVLIIYPIICTAYLLIKPDNCADASEKLGILISRFNLDNDDVFSSKVFSQINTKISVYDSIDIKKIKDKPKLLLNNDKTPLSESFEDHCYESGILLYGSYSGESKLFDCNIYLNNFFDKNNSLPGIGQDLINVQNPDYFNFSIEYQTSFIADFIMSLILSKNDEFALSNRLLFEISKDLNSDLTNSFKASCKLMMGNNYAMMGKFDLSKKSYKEGLGIDPTNKLLLHNYKEVRSLEIEEEIIEELPEIAANNSTIDNTRNSDSPNNYSTENIANTDEDHTEGKVVIDTSVTDLDEEKRNEVEELDTASREITINEIESSKNEETKVLSEFHDRKEDVIFKIIKEPNGMFGVLLNDEKYIKPEFDTISLFNYKGTLLFLSKKNGKWGAISKYQQKTQDFIFSSESQIRNYLKKKISDSIHAEY